VRFIVISAGEVERSENKTYNYFKANYDDIRKYAKSFNWNEYTKSDENVGTVWNKIKSDLIDIRNKFVPLKKASKNKCKWVTRKATKSRRSKKKAWNKYIKSGRDDRLYEIYKVKLKNSINENNAAKCSFEEKLADNFKTDSKFLCLCTK
jgi:hypothetical protein